LSAYVLFSPHRYAVAFTQDTPMSYLPRFLRIFDRNIYAVDSDERYWVVCGQYMLLQPA
jgi:hypothetical protein